MSSNNITEKTSTKFVDVLDKSRKEREKKKIKPVSCPICGHPNLKGIRSLSKHLHAEHENKSDLALQKALVNTIFGYNTVKKWLDILADKNIPTDKKTDIPSPVKKLFNILKAKDMIDIKAKHDKQPTISDVKHDNEAGLNPMSVSKVISKLELIDKNIPIGIYIKKYNSISFLKDVLHYEGINYNKDNTKGINIVLTKKIDLNKDLNKQILLSKKLLEFLKRDEIDNSELIYIDSRNEGGSKLVKIREVQEGIIFEFEFDKAYYRELIRKRVRELRKHKKIK